MRTVAADDPLSALDVPGRGPVCLIFAEDETDVVATAQHHAALGFDHVLLFYKGQIAEAMGGLPNLTVIPRPVPNRLTAIELLNSLMGKLSGRWVCYLFNSEYLFYPYMKTRGVADLAGFMEEERRQAIFTYVIDLYAQDLEQYPDAVDRQSAHFDGSGYYGFQRFSGPEALDRQYDIFGGLGWRYEEFIPWERRRIDRIAFFRAIDGLRLDENLHLNEPEMNTISCPWHNNVTIALMSFRVAKSLKRNPGSMFDIESFMWRQSVKFDWTPEQLLEHGLIEAGQWF
ncbi:hypothetical protein [Pontivivens insulae]|uniref:DUF5672 domain-containing protein n=1 Tax=Pontivivens insulae TaxID=1639689 RepID=A0A2R8AEN0_9RHOB|nr:hypothetical protein [Pontivivens insulae]RED11801.1 hypothetical protein DFR53_2511 [Pontivivens insulae]SPF30558.1 hypothetical protein POI8812_02897 [Pontivivens insulae]